MINHPLTGIPITVDRCLTGSKRAVRFGDGPIVVSPAMYDLIVNADPDELRRLLESIPLLNLPALPSRFDQLPMTTRPDPEGKS